ncbi:ATP-binding protein [Actinoplanes italicus]|uniref:Histidine kinase-like protein n=1 Tax=Actinoplanes italicus TaxID=113567 RepID=A0A2T0JXB8_9ACTN|nr:ATP-binding protein [Actinoplanes italicus]PRX12621.1 histidine kinase-like protein [Actinoplanes italicus]
MAYHQPDDLPRVRAFAQRRAEDLGMTADQVMSLVIAVSELVTNTLQHTSGGGRVRIWAENGQVTCDVIDHGPMRALGRRMPTPDAERGRGLAIVERLCGRVDAIAGDEGTIVRLGFAIGR